MNLRKVLFLIAALLICAGAISIVFIDSRGAEPELVCVDEGMPYSGFSDPEQDDCGVSDESYELWSAWDAQGNRGLGVGIVLVAAGVIAGGVGVFKKPRGDSQTASN